MEGSAFFGRNGPASEEMADIRRRGKTMLDRRLLWKLSIAALAALILAGTGVLSYRLARQAAMDALRVEAFHRLDLLAAAIDGTINRYSHMPSTLPLNPDIGALMRQETDAGLRQRVNGYLERLNGMIGSIAIYVMNAKGIVISSSNWNQPDSFVGEDLAFRPYFQMAIAGETGRFYAIGTTRGEPGYYVSRPIEDNGAIVGVAVIKIGLKPLLEEGWAWADTPAFIADDNGVVILASVANWRLTALMPLSGEHLAEIDRTRQFNRQPLGRFPVELSSDPAVPETVKFPDGGAIVGGEYLALSLRLPENGWRLTIFSDLRPAERQAWQAVAIAEGCVACLLLILGFLHLRRRSIRQKLEAQALLQLAYADLERKVEERTADLVEANVRLKAEIRERERTEKNLRAAQDDLVQAAKLAVLGQIATGITHELTQPVGALRALSENALEFMRRRDEVTLKKNLHIISTLAERMGAMISQLKAFARKSPALPQAVDVNRALANAQFLLDQRLHKAGVKVEISKEEGLMAWCDPLRLEQVLVNLMGNAIDAMGSAGERRLILRTQSCSKDRILIQIVDNGPGLSEEAIERMFEPFFTTKPTGEGLGLGLAISRDIVRDFGGTLAAHNRQGGGAEFLVTLPAPPAKEYQCH
jgi:two-component system C4-dicarboxylate transport sensor histidine kinase DctB